MEFCEKIQSLGVIPVMRRRNEKVKGPSRTHRYEVVRPHAALREAETVHSIRGGKVLRSVSDVQVRKLEGCEYDFRLLRDLNSDSMSSDSRRTPGHVPPPGYTPDSSIRFIRENGDT